MKRETTGVTTATARRGRPRTFDAAAAVASTVPIFQKYGYRGASLELLQQETGLSAGSLYKAFHGKPQLFSAAFSHYVHERRNALAVRMADCPDGREKVAELIRFYLDSSTGPTGRAGCMVLGSMVEASALNPDAVAALAESLNGLRGMLIALIDEGRADGSLPTGLPVEACAEVLLAALQGFRALGKLHDPADRQALLDVSLKILAGV
ncbi:MAG: TetR/AcrR family transcriptional regulator [Luteibacter sp.]